MNFSWAGVRSEREARFFFAFRGFTQNCVEDEQAVGSRKETAFDDKLGAYYPDRLHLNLHQAMRAALVGWAGRGR